MRIFRTQMIWHHSEAGLGFGLKFGGRIGVAITFGTFTFEAFWWDTTDPENSELQDNNNE